MIIMPRSYGPFSGICPLSQGRSLRGTAPRGGQRGELNMREAINTTINQPCKRVSIGGGISAHREVRPAHPSFLGM